MTQRQVESQLRKVTQALQRSQRRRDELIVKAANVGVTQRRIAELAGISQGRVSQILSEHRPSAR